MKNDKAQKENKKEEFKDKFERAVPKCKCGHVRHDHGAKGCSKCKCSRFS